MIIGTGQKETRGRARNQLGHDTRRKLASILLAGLMMSMGFVIIASENAKALDFVETLAVPWSGTYSPLDSAWDDTGNHCLVVGNDTSDSESDAWYYNSGSSTWSQVDVVVPPAQTLTVGSGAGNYSTTIQAAIDAANAGDTVFVWPGTYTETLLINKPMTLSGYDSASVIVDGSASGNIITVSSENVTISGMMLVNAGAGNEAVFMSSCGYLTLSELSIQTTRGLEILSSPRNRILNCSFASAYGMMIENSNGNVIQGNFMVGMGSSGMGIYFLSCENNLVVNNTISGYDDSVGNGDAVYFESAGLNMFYNNTFEDNNNGVFVDGGAGNRFYHNVFRNNVQHAYGTGVWYNPLPAGVNYWDDWTGPDADGDGIVDSPRSFLGGQDDYPWVMPHSWNWDNISLIGEWHMDEGSGQYAYDSSGNGNDIVLGTNPFTESIDPTWISPGLSGDALNFAGESAEVPYDPSLNLNDHFTLDAWVRNPDFTETRTEDFDWATLMVAQQNNVKVYDEDENVRLDTDGATISTGPRGPGALVDAGDIDDYTDPDLAMVSDNLYCNCSGAGAGPISVYLSWDGGTNWVYDSIDVNLVEGTNYGGGMTDSWGRFWDSTDFNDANFRVALGSSYYGPKYSNFGFSLPAGCFIDGIEVGVEGYYVSIDGVHRFIDYFFVNVYYNTGNYYTTGELVSSNTLITSYNSINSFETIVTDMPSGTALFATYSQDNANWYNSAGTLGGWDSIASAGSFMIDLTGLGWSGTGFYYKITFQSTGASTPILDDVLIHYEGLDAYAVISRYNSYELRVSTNSMLGRVYIGGTWQEVSGPITWEPGWNYFAFTSETNLKAVYHNGQPVGSQPMAGAPTSNTYYVSLGSYQRYQDQIHADIDEVRIWARMLSDAEILSTYENITADPVTYIYNAVDLQSIQSNLAGNYVLANDIDATATRLWNSGAGFAPIGSAAPYFTGTFDGQGYSIINLTVSRPTYSYAGLFARMESSAFIKDVHLVNADITGNNYVGAVIGMNNLGQLSNISSSGTVTGSGLVGGVVGYNSGNEITYSHSSANVTGSDDVGGLVGYTDWLSTISYSYATGTVEGDTYVGGLVGWNFQGTVTNCYATGNVTGFTEYVGGLAGSCEDGTTQDSFSTGMVNGPAPNTGGLLGYISSATINNCFWDTDTSGMTTSAAGFGRTTAEMMNPDTFMIVGWDFADTWHMTNGVTYPMFQWQPLPDSGTGEASSYSLMGVVWDPVNSWFWACGEGQGYSSIFIINDTFTSQYPVAGAPAYSFQAIACDNGGNILVGGKDLQSLWYYDFTGATGWHQVVDSMSGTMYSYNITGITFNSNDGRFYVVGDNMGGNAIAFYTDMAPLTGGALCYKDTSAFLPSSNGLLSIAWNPSKDYGLAVGDGVYRVDPYDGNPSYELNWTSIQPAEAGKTYYDVSWDSDGWNEAGISGVNNTRGNYWRYYNSNPVVIDGHTDALAGTEYLTCAMKPPSSPKWLLIPSSGGALKVNILEKDESGQLSYDSNYPHVLTVSVWKQSDVLKPDLLNKQVDADSTYTFAVEANYSVGGVDHWNNLVIQLTAWYDNGNVGTLSNPGDWASQNYRTRQFNITYSVSTSTASVIYPAVDLDTQEFCIEDVWEDPGTYGADGMTHMVLINVTFGPQAMAADGGGFLNGAAQLGQTWDKNMALNDAGSWDMMWFIHDSADPSISNRTFEEFGIKEYASIISSSSPSGSAPPGSILTLSPDSSIYYSANTPYYVTVEIPDLHRNGELLDPAVIPATSFQVQNIHSLASGNSEISSMTSFTAPDSPLYVWGAPGIPIDTPVHGNVSAGPYNSDYIDPFEVTVVTWQLTVPTVPEGHYTGTIVISIFN